MSSELEQAALAFVEELQRNYFEKLDAAVRAALDDPTDWTGIGRAEGNRPLRPGGVADLSGLPRWRIRDLELTASALDEAFCLVGGTVTVQCGEERGPVRPLRLSAVCRRGTDGLRLRQAHLSLPGGEGGEAAGESRLEEDLLRALLERREEQLAERDRNLAAIPRNLPGGIMCCDNTPCLTSSSTATVF